MSDVIGPVCTKASYEDRIRAFFALSGAVLVQPINAMHGDGIFYSLPGDSHMKLHGDPNHGMRRGFYTQISAMKAALYAMGVDIASDRWTHETKSFELAGEQRAVR